jgi:hypothetical protein
MIKEIGCTNCIHGIVCGIECKEGCKHYLDKTTAAPAYVGQTIYRIKGKWGYEDNDTLHENYKILSWYTVEGKVSMIQQKADKSWKIRMSEGGSVSDHTISQIGDLIFFDKEDAEKKAEERTNGLQRL